MFIKLVNQGTHAVVPQLYDAIVQTGKYPWSLRVKGQT